MRGKAYRIRKIIKNETELDMGVHTCNLSTWKAEARGSQV
jgi:hypothetical protein